MFLEIKQFIVQICKFLYKFFKVLKPFLLIFLKLYIKVFKISLIIALGLVGVALKPSQYRHIDEDGNPY